MTALGLCCCTQAFSSCATGPGSSLVACAGFSLWWLLLSWSTDSRACWLSSWVAGSVPAACANFLHQGSNPCPLPWQMDSHSLDHQGNLPLFPYYIIGKGLIIITGHVEVDGFSCMFRRWVLNREEANQSCFSSFPARGFPFCFGSKAGLASWVHGLCSHTGSCSRYHVLLLPSWNF